MAKSILRIRWIEEALPMKNLFHLLMASTLVIFCNGAAARAQTAGDSANYILCAFYPAAAACPNVYQEALKSDGPAAAAVKAAYQAYGKYLKLGGQGLDATDRKFLHDNQIDLPPDLSAADLAGLHNLIQDPSLAGDARRIAAINYLNRAVEAELFCHFNNCGAGAAQPLTS
jgi:hypothetical protein